MGRPKSFKPDQDEALRREHESGTSLVELGRRHSVSHDTVKAAVLRAGGTIRSSYDAVRALTPEQVEYVAREYRDNPDASLGTLAAETGASNLAVLTVLRNRGVPRRVASGKCHTLNEAAFDGAEHSPEAAYFVGLLFADGNVYWKREGGANVSISLSGDDGWLVRRFLEFLGASHPPVLAGPKWVKFPCGTVRWTKRRTGAYIPSMRLAAALAKYGVVPRKSLVAVPADCMAFNRDFWRGAVDGDGTIGVGRSGVWWYPHVGICGSLATVEGFLRFAARLTGTQTRPTRRRGQKLWNCLLAGRKALPVIRHLYEGAAVALPRKAKRAETIMRLMPDGRGDARLF